MSTKSFQIAQYQFVAQGEAAERLKKVLPKFPNLHELVYTRKPNGTMDSPPGADRDIMTRRPKNTTCASTGVKRRTETRHQTAHPIPLSTFHGWTGMIDIARALVSIPNRIDQLELNHMFPDLSICSHEELTTLRRFVKGTPSLQTLSIRLVQHDLDEKRQFLRRVPDRDAEIRIWTDVFGSMSALKSLHVEGHEHPDGDELGNSTMMRVILGLCWPRLDTLQLSGLTLHHRAFVIFLLNHRETLDEIKLDHCRRIIRPDPLAGEYYGQYYCERVIGDCVDSATVHLPWGRVIF